MAERQRRFQYLLTPSVPIPERSLRRYTNKKVDNTAEQPDSDQPLPEYADTSSGVDNANESRGGDEDVMSLSLDSSPGKGFW